MDKLNPQLFHNGKSRLEDNKKSTLGYIYEVAIYLSNELDRFIKELNSTKNFNNIILSTDLKSVFDSIFKSLNESGNYVNSASNHVNSSTVTFDPNLKITI